MLFLLCSSKFWNLPAQCAIPWQELFDLDVKGDRGSLWDSFSNEKTLEEESAMDSFLMEAVDHVQDQDEVERDMDEFLLQAADEADATDQFLLEAADEFL